VDGLELLAWQAAAADRPAPPVPELRWAGRACRDVTASSQQVHGAIGFALEAGVHVAYRRAKSVQAWTDAVCSATSE
jgi:alkylation response protein AidB-like acyl-CoA dehydrogenase